MLITKVKTYVKMALLPQIAKKLNLGFQLFKKLSPPQIMEEILAQKRA